MEPKTFLDPYEQRLLTLNDLADLVMKFKEEFKRKGLDDRAAGRRAIGAAFTKRYTGSAQETDMIAVGNILQARKKERAAREKAEKVVRKSRQKDRAAAEKALGTRWDVKREDQDSF